MKNIGISIVLISTVSSLYAGIITLKNGRTLYVPDQVTILNDLDKYIVLKSTTRFYDCCDYMMDTEGKLKEGLAPQKEMSFANDKIKAEINILTFSYKGTKHSIFIPTHIHPDKTDDLPCELFIEASYKLSDVIAGWVDEDGYAIPAIPDEWVLD